MIDLHTHTLFSDGELVPAELVRRARSHGYESLAITDHADSSNLDWIIPRIVRFCETLPSDGAFRVVPGIELTYVEPETIPLLVQESRNLGAKLVLVHGETSVESVPPGTNRAALEANVDILAHPGLISEELVAMAKEKGIPLEISARRGHSLTNGYVARVANKIGASLVFNTDAHGPGDILDSGQAERIVAGAGLSHIEWRIMQDNARTIVRKLFPDPRSISENLTS